jgi:hypothetical protein
MGGRKGGWFSSICRNSSVLIKRYILSDNQKDIPYSDKVIKE